MSRSRVVLALTSVVVGALGLAWVLLSTSAPASLPVSTAIGAGSSSHRVLAPVEEPVTSIPGESGATIVQPRRRVIKVPADDHPSPSDSKHTSRTTTPTSTVPTTVAQVPLTGASTPAAAPVPGASTNGSPDSTDSPDAASSGVGGDTSSGGG